MEIACDSALQNRHYEENGQLRIERTPISKATVNPYYGREIPKAEELGLEPERIYYLLRDPGELAKAAPSFKTKQLMFKHIAVSADDPKQDSIAGTVGSDVEFVAPYLMADMCVWDAEAIAGIETDTVRELSCSYSYRADMTPGMYEGQRYDGVMRDIQGNHVALVKSGRAGSDVMAADEKQFALDWEESKHPRSENGEFANGEGGGHVEKRAEPRWQINPKWKAHNDLYNEGGEGYNPYEKWLNNIPGASSYSVPSSNTSAKTVSKEQTKTPYSKERKYVAPGSSIPKTRDQIKEDVEKDKAKLDKLEGFGKEIVAKGIAAREKFLSQIANDSKLEMKMETKFGKALYAILCAASPKLAADAALKPLVIGLTRKQCDLRALEPKLLAMDSALRMDSTRLAMDAVEEATEERPKAKDRIARDAQTGEEKAMWAQMRKDGSADDPGDDSMPASLRKASDKKAKDGAPRRAKDLSFEEWAKEEEEEPDHEKKAARDAEEDDEDRAKRKEYEKKAEDAKKAMDGGFDDLVKKLKDKGYSKEYATKVAGKVAEEKGDCAFGAKDGKKAKDAEEDDKKKAEDKMKHAMDEFRADLRSADEARRAVRPVVGDVLAQDSAEGIYGFALDQMKVDRTGVEGVPALRALFNLAHQASKPAAHVAFDSSINVEEKFTGAGRQIQVM